MSSKSNNINPTAFIAIGICFMGAGVTLGITLNSAGVSGVGIGLIGVGVMFLLIGVAQKRKIQQRKIEDDE